MPPRKRKAVQARLDDTEESAVEAHPNHSEEAAVQARPNRTENAAVQAPLDHTDKSAMHPAYNDLLPEAARTFLFSDAFSNALAVTLRECPRIFNVSGEAALEEFRRLIAIKFWTVDLDATKISPSCVMDHVWHAAILDTKLYDKLQASLGVKLHHNPAGAEESDRENRDKRLANMKANYRHFFKEEPANATRALRQRLKPDRDIFVKHADGSTVFYPVHSSDLVSDLMDDIEKKKGIPPDQQRLIYNGTQLVHNNTLMSYGIEHESTIVFLFRLRGC